MEQNTKLTKIARIVERERGIPEGELENPKRRRHAYTMLSAHLFTALASDRGYSTPEIGNFTKRDHSTIVDARKAVRSLLKYDGEFKAEYDRLSELIDAGA